MWFWHGTPFAEFAVPPVTLRCVEVRVTVCWRRNSVTSIESDCWRLTIDLGLGEMLMRWTLTCPGLMGHNDETVRLRKIKAPGVSNERRVGTWNQSQKLYRGLWWTHTKTRDDTQSTCPPTRFTWFSFDGAASNNVGSDTAERIKALLTHSFC